MTPSDQAQAYREAWPNSEVVALPMGTPVGPQYVRQWICEHFGDVCMLDDDVTSVTRLWMPPGGGRQWLNWEELREWVDAAANLTRCLGAYMFSMRCGGNAILYQPQKPFSLTGCRMGWLMGVLVGGGIHFPPDAVCVEDTYAWLYNAHCHRYCFLDNRFAVQTVQHGETPGGCAVVRTSSTSAAAYAFLRRMFGSVVVANGAESRNNSYSVKLPF